MIIVIVIGHICHHNQHSHSHHYYDHIIIKQTDIKLDVFVGVTDNRVEITDAQLFLSLSLSLHPFLYDPGSQKWLMI